MIDVKLAVKGARHSVASPAERIAMLPEKQYKAIPYFDRDFTEWGFAKVPFRSAKSYIKRNAIPGLRLPGRI
jgi:hypothetical protein